MARRFAEYELRVSASGPAYLSIKVSGERINTPECDNLVLFEVDAEFTEPVQLKRDSTIEFAHGAAIWAEDMVDVVAEHLLVDFILDYSDVVITDFCQSVRSANHEGE